jgi:hypothetical protein
MECSTAEFEVGGQERLKKLNFVRNSIKSYDVDMLVKIAAELIRAYRGEWCNEVESMYSRSKLGKMIQDLLVERSIRLNKEFQWTDEKRAKFIEVSKQLFHVSVKLRKESEEIAALLNRRFERGGSILKGYGIESRFSAFPEIEGDRKTSEVVELWLADPGISHLCEKVYWSYFSSESDNNDVSKTHQWSEPYVDEGYEFESPEKHFEGEFENDFISYAVKKLMEYSSGWSVPDVLSIWTIESNVEVKYKQCNV